MYGEFYKEVMDTICKAKREVVEKAVRPAKTKIMSAAKKGLRECKFQISYNRPEDINSYDIVCSFLKAEGFNFEIEDWVVELNTGDLVQKVFTVHW